MRLYNLSKNKKTKITTFYLVRIAIMSAILTVAKLALSFIPNVEVVTLLIMVYGSALGAIYVVPASIIFCLIEMAIYGFGSWSILYLIFWPLLGLISSLLLRDKNPIFAIIIAVISSMLFGLLSACTDTLFCVMDLSSSDLRKYFVAYYLRGISFDIIHTISNAIIIGVLYNILIEVFRKIMPEQFYARGLSFRKIISIKDEYKRVVL